jgi:hypothetical protein
LSDDVAALDIVIKFMEDHPNIDLGSPGPLVHFAERFYKRGLEERLLQSIARKPVFHTVWMLNRVINGTNDAEKKQSMIEVLIHAKDNPIIDSRTRIGILHFLRFQTK